MDGRWDAAYRSEVLATSARLQHEAAEVVARAWALRTRLKLERSDRSWRRSGVGRGVGTNVRNARLCDTFRQYDIAERGLGEWGAGKRPRSWIAPKSTR